MGNRNPKNRRRVMAGKKPSFVTGANAKIKSGGLTIAYAQDVSYVVSTTTIPIETMGRYEVVSNEPVAYFCEGSLSVIRYTKVAALKNMSGVAQNGNGLGNWNFSTGGNASEHINPAKMLASQTWDMEVFQKYDDGGIETELLEKIKDCRFTRKGGGLNKRGVLVENFAFVGILAEGDSFDVGESGDEDLSV